MSAERALAKDVRDFKAVAKYWKTFSGLATLVVSVSPAAAFAETAAFPGMTRMWVPLLGPFSCVCVVLFLFFKSRDRSAAEIDRVATLLFATGICLLLAYVSMWFNSVIQVDGQWHVIGPQLTPEASKAVAEGWVPDDAKALLDRFGHGSDDRVWLGRPWVFVLLTASATGFFAALAGSFFLFTLLRAKRAE